MSSKRFSTRRWGQGASENMNDYLQTGKVKYVFRNFLLEAVHKQAFKSRRGSRMCGRSDTSLRRVIIAVARHSKRSNQ